MRDEVADSRADLPVEALPRARRLLNDDPRSSRWTRFFLATIQRLHLVQLKLSSNRLTVLPDGIFGMSQLRVLDVSRNSLTVLPRGEFAQLVYFVADKNQLTELPLLPRSTEFISVSKNALTELPDSIHDLSNLKNLNVASNKLRELPKTRWWRWSSSSLKKLERLRVDDNQLQKLPDWIDQLSELQSLNASTNSLTELPDSISELSALQTLVIHNNRLTKLPDALNRQVLDEKSAREFVTEDELSAR